MKTFSTEIGPRVTTLAPVIVSGEVAVFFTSLVDMSIAYPYARVAWPIKGYFGPLSAANDVETAAEAHPAVRSTTVLETTKAREVFRSTLIFADYPSTLSSRRPKRNIGVPTINGTNQLPAGSIVRPCLMTNGPLPKPDKAVFASTHVGKGSGVLR